MRRRVPGRARRKGRRDLHARNAADARGPPAPSARTRPPTAATTEPLGPVASRGKTSRPPHGGTRRAAAAARWGSRRLAGRLKVRVRHVTDRCTDGRRRLPRPQRGHPRRRAKGINARPRVRRLPLRLGRRAGGRLRPAHLREHARDPPPRRHDPRHLEDEPVQGGGRPREAQGRARRAGRRRADPDRRRGHARRGPPADGRRRQRRRRPEDDRQRPRRHGLHVRLPDRGADRDGRDRPPAHDGGVAQPRDHRRGDGPPRRLDRLLRRHGRRRRRDARARAAVRPRRDLRAAQATASPTAPRSRSSSSPRAPRPRTATSGASTAARTRSATRGSAGSPSSSSARSSSARASSRA